MKSFSVQVIVEEAINGGATATLLGMSLQILILDILTTILFTSTLQSIYPIPNIPWAMPSQREVIISEVTFFLYALALAFPDGYFLTPYCYLVTFVLTACVIFMPNVYYDKLVT
jgi:hypothetical protein